jgi:hypothetical protein
MCHLRIGRHKSISVGELMVVKQLRKHVSHYKSSYEAIYISITIYHSILLSKCDV